MAGILPHYVAESLPIPRSFFQCTLLRVRAADARDFPYRDSLCRGGAPVIHSWAKGHTTRPDAHPHDHRGATCARAVSVRGSQNVMSMARYISMAVESSVRAGSRWPVAAYSVPRPQWQ